jgi:general secretion pathway protein K
VRRRSAERGIALIAVLWGTALLALLAGSFADAARTETRIAHHLVERTRAAALADAGVYRAILALLDPLPERRWRDDGEPYALALAGGAVEIRIQDEGGRIDLNAAPGPLLQGLLRTAGLAEDESAALVDRLADWRDADDLRRPHGAEARDYRAAGYWDGPKNGEFQAVEELRQVPGVSPALYERIAAALTVHSGRPSVNTATAPAQVLLSMPGMDEVKVEALLAARERMLGGGAAAAQGAGRTLNAARSRIATWSIRAAARTDTGAGFAREAVVRRSEDPERPFLVLAWRRAAPVPTRLTDADPGARTERAPGMQSGQGATGDGRPPGASGGDGDVRPGGGGDAVVGQPGDHPRRAHAARQVGDVDARPIFKVAGVADLEIGAGDDALARRGDPDVEPGGAATTHLQPPALVAAGAQDADLEAGIDQGAAFGLHQEGVKVVVALTEVAFDPGRRAGRQRGRIDLEAADVGDVLERHAVVGDEDDRQAALQLDAARLVLDRHRRRVVGGDLAQHHVLRGLDEDVGGDHAEAAALADHDRGAALETAIPPARQARRARQLTQIEAAGRRGDRGRVAHLDRDAHHRHQHAGVERAVFAVGRAEGAVEAFNAADRPLDLDRHGLSHGGAGRRGQKGDGQCRCCKSSLPAADIAALPIHEMVPPSKIVARTSQITCLPA